MKKIVLLAILMLVISVRLPPHVFVYAKKQPTIANGVYQVELSFLSQDAEGQEVLFDKKAVLTVYEDRYTVSVPVLHENTITSLTAKQQGDTLTTSIGRAENLVQFDMKNIQQKFVLTGKYKKSTASQELSFSQILVIDEKSLPKKQTTSPVREEEITNQQDVDLIDYKLLTYGTTNPSVMNDYVDSTMKVIKRDNRFYAHMQITESAWITDITVEQQGKMVEPKVVSRKENTRIIEFEIEDFRKKTKIWVEVNLPELTYSYDYFVELLFNEEQVKKFTGNAGQPVENQAKSSMAKRSEEPVKPSRPSRMTKSVEKEEAPVKPIPKPTLEEKLNFDRTQDEVVKKDSTDGVQIASEPTKVDLAVNPPDSPVISMDVLKVVVLFSLCALSGVLFIRRLIKRKKTVVNR